MKTLLALITGLNVATGLGASVVQAKEEPAKAEIKNLDQKLDYHVSLKTSKHETLTQEIDWSIDFTKYASNWNHFKNTYPKMHLNLDMKTSISPSSASRNNKPLQQSTKKLDVELKKVKEFGAKDIATKDNFEKLYVRDGIKNKWLGTDKACWDYTYVMGNRQLEWTDWNSANGYAATAFYLWHDNSKLYLRGLAAVKNDGSTKTCTDNAEMNFTGISGWNYQKEQSIFVQYKWEFIIGGVVVAVIILAVVLAAKSKHKSKK